MDATSITLVFFTALAALTFLRLLAVARETVLLQAEAAANEKQAREELEEKRQLAMAESVSDVKIV
ncbi:MAG: hypothetical protein MI923_07420 [Phycisphaerales bacterium]|nr:hypothetical protein [Phycisphaerales bacterium]